MNGARAFKRAFGLGLTVLAATGCNAIFGLEEAELGDPFGADASAGTGGTSQGGANQGGANQGGANQGGANQGGANQGGANQGGANQGGANQGGANQGGANQGGANQGGANQGGANQGGANQGGANQGGAAGQGGTGQGGASGQGGTAGTGGVSGAGGSDPTCNDSQKNGSETDTDCGGGMCTPCGIGKTCKVGTDCVDLACDNVCLPPRCDDGLANGDETDKDCGGSCPADCSDGWMCKLGTDCVSQVCKNGFCEPPGCNDTVMNGSETDIDCGAVCPGKLCADTRKCLNDADCISGVCTAGTCAASSCSDGVKNGTESDVDCGGAACPQRCTTDKACSANSDCVDGVCANNKCSAPVCGDWVKNGNEFCDDGPNNGMYNGPCSTDCTSVGPHCGDGIVQSGKEQCDGPGTSGACGLYDATKPAGATACTTACMIDTSGCKACDYGNLYTGWSGEQQKNGLSYLCTGINAATPMTYDAAADRWSTPGGCSFKRAPAGYVPSRAGQEEALFEGATGDPTSNALYNTAIAWKAPATLPVKFNLVARSDNSCGDGVNARVWVGKNLVSEKALQPAFRDFSATLPNVVAGDEIRVEFEPLSTNDCDTFWIKSLTFVQQYANACSSCNQGAQLPGKLCLPQSPSYLLNLGYTPHTTRIADVDGDRKADLLISGNDAVHVLTGNGTGTVTNKAVYAGKCGATRELEFIKLGTGPFTDLITTCSSGFETGRSQGAAQFVFNDFFTLTGAGQIEVGSLNADAFPDVVIGKTSGTDPLQLCTGSATGTFTCSAIPNAGSGGVTSMFLAHVNGDSLLDLIATTTAADEVLIFVANTDFTFSAPVSNAASHHLGLAADFNQDGVDDVVAFNPTTNGFQVFKGTASAYLASSGEFAGSLQGPPGAMSKVDLNVDGLPDFLATEGSATLKGRAEAFISKQAGVLSFDQPWSSSLSTNPSRSYGITSGDLNGDGAPDVVVTLFDDKQIRVFLSNP